MPGKSEAGLLLDSLFHVDLVIVMILDCLNRFSMPLRREDSGSQMLSPCLLHVFFFHYQPLNHQTFINFGVATVFEQPFWDDYDWSTKNPYGASLDRSHEPCQDVLCHRRISMLSSGQKCKLALGAAFWTRPRSIPWWLTSLTSWSGKKTLERGQKTPRYQEMSRTLI